MDVDEAADELYGLLPDEFTARRNELAAQARADGDAAARNAISQLRRPTVAAWLVNTVVRTHPADVDALLRLGDELRSAQRKLAAAELRELSVRRREAIGALAEVARSAAADAGHPVGDDALRDVQATLEAAVADEQAETAVRSGRLTTALSYSGFGGVDVTDAVAAAGGKPRLTLVRSPAESPSRPDTGSRGAAAKQHKREVAQARLAEAQDAADKRNRALDSAKAALDDATRRRDDEAAAVDRLASDLERAQRDLRVAEAELHRARRDHDAARRAAERAAERLTSAEQDSD
jgi:hypothetical protein